MSSSSNTSWSDRTPTPEPENHPDPPPVLGENDPGEQTPAETGTPEAPFTIPSPTSSSIQKMFLELEEELDWSNDTLPPELTNFLIDKMNANDKNLKFFTRNSLITIKEIVEWGSQDIQTILQLFPNHHDDKDFIHSIVMIHHLTEFFRIEGEQAKSKTSALLTPSSSS